MIKFKKMVAIEPTKLLPEWDEKLKELAEEAIFYEDIPTESAVIIDRISDADCVMLSFTSFIDKEVLDACPNIRYIGICASLYAPENANVDIRHAEKKGIVVTGVRDYGDEGVKEYAISELVRLLQGRGSAMWKDEPMELTDVKVGIVGMGTVGSLLARTMNFFGMDVNYYSRTRKPEMEEEVGMAYLPLDKLLDEVDILITCLNKNVVLLDEAAFQKFGNGKILMNVSIAPSHEVSALRKWLDQPGNYAFSDTEAGLGEEVIGLPNVFAGKTNAGLTSMAKVRLAQKVIQNIEEFQKNN
ncbi:NAD(P)-dependent oxidoreductase [Enterococcus raffinosus]|uniref:NAD(P)-dependent oxidoreductase n=1 Tax=Enterococcus raffinosus TaxID=71452 RepID=A0AAW8T7I6_9ENTE|nr:NAD(P)-dependent oxidoreductase [Enterococcus raffinosus]MDT2524172.1 NAD(P)-dependent oxidoreductase [Enterococcus raffinosus]MDT2531625.1 NAD(P)-dependent oxidoreductase [Enterococcus raffinosus]MDT2535089.1 NAD(P)-dependent oxidoreductase [Enterococcus raffinosus]MDT2545110.1 NAD(P)-dependent oxidoreductase [Enterococcus raffinosus]MDT2554790.1 NAD(P)-dependent oxidoreductase [Enterococcus raffinosus]